MMRYIFDVNMILDKPRRCLDCTKYKICKLRISPNSAACYLGTFKHQEPTVDNYIGKWLLHMFRQDLTSAYCIAEKVKTDYMRDWHLPESLKNDTFGKPTMTEACIFSELAGKLLQISSTKREALSESGMDDFIDDLVKTKFIVDIKEKKIMIYDLIEDEFLNAVRDIAKREKIKLEIVDKEKPDEIRHTLCK